MSDYEYDVKGAPVVYTNRAPVPNNPLIRPKINYIKPVITIISYMVFNFLIVLFYNFIENYLKQFVHYKTISLLIFILLNVVFIGIVLKRTLIWLVHVYQRYAPDEVRLKCVFEPSCSEYMILSLQKYGVIKGIIKGIDRLFRCHLPNGGCDMP